MPFLELLIIFLVGLFASSIGTIVGGGGLINVPMFIFLGLPAQSAVATNKLSNFGFLAGFYKFKKEGKVDMKLGLVLATFTMIGGLIGANLLLQMQENILKRLIGVITILVLAVIILKRNIGLEKIKTKVTPVKRFFGYIVTFFLGIYNGFFGGGVGTFYSYVLILIFGQTFIESAGTRKVLTLLSNFIATIVFLMAGIINYTYFIVLFSSTVIGSYVGSAYAIKKGEKWVRNLFIVVVLLMAIKLLFF